MGIVIKSSAICVDPESNSAVELAARAGEECMANSGLRREEVDLLIFTGVFRDDNIVEPAIAALVQKRMGLNTDPVSDGNVIGTTFSFDLIKGRCGFLYAAKVAQGMIENGRAAHALIVSSDVHPSGRYNPEFPVTHSGAAALLSRSENGRGFRKIVFNSGTDSYIGEIVYVGENEGIKARKAITIEREKDYIPRAGDLARKTAKKYIQGESVNPGNVKLLITTPHGKSWEKDLSRSLGMNHYTKSVNIYKKYGDTYSSALIFGFFHAVRDEKLKEEDEILFVAAGAGLSSACCRYIV